ncbi:hypothetical protein [uncultured Clostridium sp.]|uniref:hypothetical protein n=1 Tax=uncultured Clostridium sp. TaxID=59620 RepID=UPI0028E70C64|nr:hypothetical protein [uncultured Clostridium sp.]
MSDYKLDIKGTIELSDYSSINDYMEIVNENDSLTINLTGNKDEFGIICSMLKEKGFYIIREELGSQWHYILAGKRNRE